MADGSQASNGDFTVDTDKLKPAVAKLQTLATQLKSAGKQLDDVCQSYGQPWGDDSTGKKFYDKYEDPHSQMITAAYRSSATLEDSAGQMGDMVTSFEKVEETAGDEGRRLRVSADDPHGDQGAAS
ncbi:hypothetical protein K7472_14510 [Streptomyces sp. PTM05]|uniref:WXG100 family type VII secretion target n=1 Tax=Streptantibioticus parmotrematis TaxID=2873249 RepID=A0ABS7QS93_9ACTN|nr:hypothetical protein [Streptantibioticus parmotrematis]MBY8886061.1 hypothetical protein [Streptantibioticus parmotrematis]